MLVSVSKAGDATAQDFSDLCSHGFHKACNKVFYYLRNVSDIRNREQIYKELFI